MACEDSPERGATDAHSDESGDEQGRLLPDDWAALSPLIDEKPEQPLPDLLGDHYRIERELGRGGTARVFLALHTKHNCQGWPSARLRVLLQRVSLGDIKLPSSLPR